MRVLNRGDKPTTVTAVYTPDGGGFAAVKIAIAPRQVVVLNDIVFTTMRSTGLGALELQGDVASLIVTSRTYNTNARGTFGQFVASANTADAIGGVTHAFVTHMRNDADFRSNLGFTEVAGGAGVVHVNGQDINVAAFQHVQMPAAGSGDIVADFSVVSGSARILAYGSMVDNRSGDAIYVPARVTPTSAQTLYAPAINAAGALGTHWRTEVVLANVAGGPVVGPLQYLDRGFVIDPAVPLLRFPDIVATLGREQTMGLLRFGPTTGILATARIYTDSDAGTFGQFVPFAAEGHGGDLIQIEVSDAFRTNLGAGNLGSAPVVARFTMFDAAGNTLATTERVLQPLELVQFPLAVSAARVRVDGDVLAYASVVDNRSGDAIFVPAQ